MDFRKIIFIIVFFAASFFNTLAFAFDQEYQEKYNEALWSVYERILQVKDLYPELKNFARKDLIENENGFNEITYSFKFSDDYSKGFEDEPYAFRFSIKAKVLEGPIVQADNEIQNWSFPILGIRVGLEVSYFGQMSTFNPRNIVDKSLRDLTILEQGYLPFRLEVEPSKELYELKESIAFTVRLRNLGVQAYKVLDLDENSLYCQIDDMIWGSEVPQDTVEKVLPPYGSLTKALKVQGIAAPKEAEISCRYGMTFRGVRPYGQVVIHIKPLT